MRSAAVFLFIQQLVYFMGPIMRKGYMITLCVLNTENKVHDREEERPYYLSKKKGNEG